MTISTNQVLALLPSNALPKKGDPLLYYPGLGIAVPLAPAVIPTSYTNPQGSGNRVGITVTESGGWWRVGTLNMFYNGVRNDNIGIYPISVAGCEIIYEFNNPRLVDEIKFYANGPTTGATMGFWVFQGRNTVSEDWSANLCAETEVFARSDTATNPTVFNLSVNKKRYKYYRMLGVGGSLSDYYFSEIEFKIDEGL